MDPSQQLGQAAIEFIAFFLPAFVVFLTVEWVVGLFRRDG
jgi:hypothetical protein